MHTLNHRSNLNPNQIHLLTLLYKFRFITPKLIAAYKKSSLSSTNHSLAVLMSRGYIERNFFSRYRIQGKAAEYYLSAKGIAYLRDAQQLDKRYYIASTRISQLVKA